MYIYICIYVCLNVQNVSAILEDTCGLNFNRHLCYLSVSSYLTHLITVLLWSRPPGTLPFRPRANRSNVNVLVALLLLTAGDIEANPGPASARPSRRAPIAPSIAFEVLNVRSAVHKAALIHNVIDDYDLDVLALS